VSSGETIYSIACYYGDVSPEAIIALNGLEEPYKLTAGQKLNIP
jgi:LysM repeat protein